MSNIPLMYQAQLPGRGQVQYFSEQNKPAYQWVEEWRDALSQDCPDPEPPHLVLKENATINWRYVSNSGQDDTLIRPIIGAKGYPMVTGSSMKGLFKRVCTPEQGLKYCGGETKLDDITTTKPGQLIFYGGFVRDKETIDDSAVDIVHGQQDWQVKDVQAKHSANIQIALKEPTFTFIIGSTTPLTLEEKAEVQAIWHQALTLGLGSRTSAGYGQVRGKSPKPLCQTVLSAYGTVSKLPNGRAELRPNMFKAALRGHTLRLFGGFINSATAELLTKKLWGGFGNNQSIVGYLSIDFVGVNWDIDESSTNHYRHYDIPRYELDRGTLKIFANQHLKESKKKILGFVIRDLLKFSLLMGGFGHSWRRIDHCLFFPTYERFPIGCHWFFEPESDKINKNYIVPINQLNDIGAFLTDFREKKVKSWINKIEKKELINQPPPWREVWHPDKVQVWARVAESKNDSQAIRWFHEPYMGERTIKKTSLTGSMGTISRIWHRMYPRYLSTVSGEIRPTIEFIEILTIFVDESEGSPDTEFLRFLDQETDFEKVYPV